MSNLYYDSDDTTHEQDDKLVLVQFGVKGMRWGVIRDNPSGGSGGGTKAKRDDITTRVFKTQVESQTNLAKETRDEIARRESGKPSLGGRMKAKILNTEIESLSNLAKEYGEEAKVSASNVKSLRTQASKTTDSKEAARLNKLADKEVEWGTLSKKQSDEAAAGVTKAKASLEKHMADGGKGKLQRRSIESLKKEADDFEAGAKQAQGKLDKWTGKLKEKQAAREAKQEANTPKTPEVKKMSDAELQTAIKRLNLERDYVRLTSEDSGKRSVSAGRQAANEILATQGKKLIGQYVLTGMKAGVTLTLGLAANEVVRARTGVGTPRSEILRRTIGVSK